MKKLFLIFVGVALAAAVLATAGFVYAATEDPPETETTEDADIFTPRGFMGRRDSRMFGLAGGGDGIMGDYMFPSIAEAFGLNEDQVEAFEKVRDTMQGIRDGFSFDEIQAKMKGAFTSAAGKALDDGAITRDQYDQMLQNMEQRGERDFGPLDRRGMRPGFGFDEFPLRGGGIIQEYMDSAMAQALNLSIEELQSMKDDGLNMNDYAVEHGMTVEELQNMMKEIHTSALNAAFDDGAITEDQYQMMLERLENSDGRLPFGPGTQGSRGW